MLGKIGRMIVCAALVAVIIFSFISNHTQNHAGGYSSVTVMNEAERAWILEHFDEDYASVEAFLLDVQEYAYVHFRYDYEKSVFFQHFDFSSLVHRADISGICFDFAVLFKHIFLVLLEEGRLPAEGAKVFVVDVRDKKWEKEPHSYNVVMMPDGRNYHIDLTTVAALGEFGYGKPTKVIGFSESIEEHAEGLGDFVTNLH